MQSKVYDSQMATKIKFDRKFLFSMEILQPIKQHTYRQSPPRYVVTGHMDITLRYFSADAAPNGSILLQRKPRLHFTPGI
jgi:hypothetical protein